MTALGLYMNHFKANIFVESSNLSRRATRSFRRQGSNPKKGHTRNLLMMI